MIGILLGGFAASPWMRSALRYGAIAVAVLLFLLSLRRSGERTGGWPNGSRPRREAMMHNDGCSRRRRVALGLATIWLSGCATVSSDGGRFGACPPVVEYSREFQSRAAAELALLPEGSAIVAMLADYAVLREQIRVR